MESLLLKAYKRIGKLLHHAGWMEYVQRLHGYENEVTLEFTPNASLVVATPRQVFRTHHSAL
jgi:hypothetical protein